VDFLLYCFVFLVWREGRELVLVGSLCFFTVFIYPPFSERTPFFIAFFTNVLDFLTIFWIDFVICIINIYYIDIILLSDRIDILQKNIFYNLTLLYNSSATSPPND